MMHTPGPWTVDSDDGIDFTILGGKTSQVRIAVETSERDARLIAAAPDMLAALRLLMSDPSRKGLLPDTVMAARAAIACATNTPET